MSLGPDELQLETIAPEDADLIDLRYEGVDLPLDQNDDPTQVELACGEHLGVVALEGGYEDGGFIDLHFLGEAFRGESAYEVAVRNGFSGSEAAWLESLIGPESPNAAEARAAQAAAEQAAREAEAARDAALAAANGVTLDVEALVGVVAEGRTYRDEAGLHAEASLQMRTLTETATGQALTYRDQASESFEGADSAAQRAELAEGAVVILHDQARGFSEASAESSQSAQGYMDDSRVEAQAARDAHLLAETARENSQGHAQASYDASQVAIAKSTEAGEHAEVALTSRLAAEAAYGDTNQLAQAVIEDRQIVIAKADQAGEYAEAAEAHRVAAFTSAGAAQISAENSAISEDGAEGARVEAVQARDIAVDMASQAGDHAEAALEHMEQAGIYADESGEIYGVVAQRQDALEAKLRIKPNRIRNPTGANAFEHWLPDGVLWGADYDVTWGAWFNRRFEGANGLYSTLATEQIAIYEGVTMTFSGNAFLSGLISGQFLLHIPMYDAVGNYVGEANRTILNGHNGPFEPLTFTPPAGARVCRVYLYLLNVAGSGVYAHAGAYRLKLETGTVATAYSDEATAQETVARLGREETTRSGQFGAVSQRTDTLEAKMNGTQDSGLKALVNDEVQARTSAIDAEALARQGLSAEFTTIKNRIFAETFENDHRGWRSGYSGGPYDGGAPFTPLAAYPHAGNVLSYPRIPGVGKVLRVMVQAGNSQDISPEAVDVLKPGRKYSVSARVRQITGPGSYFDLFMINLNHVFNLGSGYYSAGRGTPNINEWQELTVNQDAESLIAGGGVYWRSLLRLVAPASGDATFEVQFIRTEDVTDAVKINARIDAEQITRAAGDSAEALARTNMEVALKGQSLGYVNDNPRFDSWPNPATAPYAWGWWSLSGSRVVREQGRNSVRFDTTGNIEPTTAGLHRVLNTGQKKGWYVVSVEVMVEVGNLIASGFLFRPMNLAGDILSYNELMFNNLAPVGHTVPTNGVEGQVYRYDILIDCSASLYDTMEGISFYVMVDGYWSVNRKKLRIDFAGWRRATPTEVQLQQARSGYVDLSAKLGALDQARVDGDGALAIRTESMEARFSSPNLITKSQFFASEQGTIPAPWTGGGHNGAATAVAVWEDVAWSPPGERSLAAWEAAGPGPDRPQDGYYDFYSEAIPWKGSQRGCADVLSGAHRCNVRIILAMLDINYTALAFRDVDVTAVNNGEVSGGVRLQDFKRLYTFFTPPAECAYVRVLLRKGATYPGNTSSYAFWARPMVSEASPTQSLPPPWAPSSAEARLVETSKVAADAKGKAYALRETVLDVNGYVSGTRSENNGLTSSFKIRSDLFEVGSPAGGARTEFSGGNWRVYDANGVLRTRMGVW